ncbi:MAG TPA: macro domain-containing protein [Candidatus Didemnitutus sp.]|nr:macro domain-containing protein [Candidatus Didemnitutus sp.]
MRIILSDRKAPLLEAWREIFANEDAVQITDLDIRSVDCDAIVSPANSFGFMDGGLDHLLSDFFGWHVQERVQAAIRTRPMRELLVGEAIVVPTDHAGIPWLIAAPTMRVPMVVRKSVNAYLAMKAILLAATAHQHEIPIRTVAVPGLATGIGRIEAKTAARQMYAAYAEVVQDKSAYPGSFGDAQRMYIRLNPDANLSET